MKSGSWSSYRAAMPPECFGEPDDDLPRSPSPPRCDRCGRFTGRGPGSGSRLDVTPASIFGDGGCELLCPACAARTPLPPTEEELREAERRTFAAEEAAHREVWEREAAEMRGRCQWCGTKLPDGRAVDVCAACEASVTADELPYDGEAIPW
jgi:hypothetical protein